MTRASLGLGLALLVGLALTPIASAQTHADTLALPFALAVEGASGPVDSSVMALFPDAKIKEKAAELDKA